MVKFMDYVHLLVKTDKNTKANGQMVWNKGMVHINGQMAENIKDNIN